MPASTVDLMRQLASLRASRSAGSAGWPGIARLQALTFMLRDLLALLPIVAGVFVGLGHPLQDLNEGIYARVPQEMLETGQWIIPMLDGVPYLEKPPLLYWLTAAAYATFGVSEWTARTGPVLGILLMLSAVYWFARRHLRGDTAILATCMTASTPIAIVLGRTVLFESLFAGFIAWSLVCVYEYWRDMQARHWIRWSYAFLALAVLTKGFAAIIFFAMLCLVFAASGGVSAAWRRIRALPEPLALGVFLAIMLPWHVLASVQQPGFAMFYIVNEHILRFVGLRVPYDYHTGPWWYYLPRLAAYTCPWLLVLLIRTKSTASRGNTDPTPGRFLWCWLLVPLVVFSLSEAKGEHYLLLMIPPLMLLLARRLSALRDRRALLLMPAISLVILLFVRIRTFAPYHAPSDTGPLLGAAALLGCVAIAAFLARKHVVAVVATAAITLPVVLIFSGFFMANEELKSTKSLAQFIRSHGIAEVYLYRDFETLSSLPFYLDAPVGVVASASSDLMYGVYLKPDWHRFPTTAEFASAAARRPVWLVVERKRWWEFQHSPLVTQFIVQRDVGHHLLLVSTRAMLAKLD
jgi:4-amino-4-deoxy-L-arabinose transferase-like glycosyltransferase